MKITKITGARGNYGHKGPFWYFTTHGVQPGSVPKDVNILEIRDTPNGTFFSTDGVLTLEELKYFDIKEKSPIVESEDVDDKDFDRLWNEKFGEPTTEVLTTEDFVQFLNEVTDFASR